jgi:hypothetical protein
MQRFVFNMLLAVILLSYLGNSVLGQGFVGIMPCRDGETRPCGSDVGVCEKGTLTCENQMWGDCEGGVKADEEVCNDGLDNDCNGLVDDCGFNTVSIIMIASGLMLIIVALILTKMGK